MTPLSALLLGLLLGFIGGAVLMFLYAAPIKRRIANIDDTVDNLRRSIRDDLTEFINEKLTPDERADHPDNGPQ